MKHSISSSTRANLIVIIGVLFLFIGIFSIFYNWKNFIANNKNITKVTKLKMMVDSLNSAEPMFEIGYGIIELTKFNDIKQKGSKPDSDLLAFPVLNNDVTKRIELNSPSLQPNYVTLRTIDGYLNEFLNVYRKKKVKIREIGVGCLIVKQIGKGKADSVQLDLSKDILGEPIPIYDATDMGIDPDYKITPNAKFLLGTMDTGSSILIPLYITNLFDRLDGGTDPPGWILVNNTIYTPITLWYLNNKKRVEITLNKVLERPIDIH